MAFLTEPEPERGKPLAIAPGILRLVARNPSKMTCHGTNTYLIEAEGGFLVLDPGPATDEQHVADILAATGGKISGVVISHGHQDHVGALEALQQRIEAPTYGYPASIAPDFTPDVALRHGDRIAHLQALHTPGHAPDHLCLADGEGLVFTADHIMGWSSSVVSPPNGSMADYVASLQMMIDRDDRIYLPGHGPALPDPRDYVIEMRRRRMAREQEILEALQTETLSVPQISTRLYAKIDPVLQSAAERNVMSHLQKLWSEGRVVEDDEGWVAVD